MTSRAPYRAPQLTELGSVAQMTQVSLIGLDLNLCLFLQANPLADITLLVQADGGCAAAPTS